MKIFVSMIAVILVASAAFLFLRSSGSEEMRSDSMMQDGRAPHDDSMMNNSATQIFPYSPEKLALAENGVVLLFFHAEWCPVCRRLDTEASQSNFTMPEGVYVLKVDYDSETALKQKYGVTVQHTFVQVRQDGSVIAKWSDALSYEDVFARIK